MKTKLVSNRLTNHQAAETSSPFNCISGAFIKIQPQTKFDKAVNKAAVRILTPIFESKTMARVDNIVNNFVISILNRIFGQEGY